MIIEGGKFKDYRGEIGFINDFNMTDVKRFYTIFHPDTNVVRAWQGHKIEQRWFSVVLGSFKIKLIIIDNWEDPSKNLTQHTFILNANQVGVLHVPAGYVSSIQAMDRESKLIVMADYLFGEIDDEYKYDENYFNVK